MQLRSALLALLLSCRLQDGQSSGEWLSTRTSGWPCLLSAERPGSELRKIPKPPPKGEPEDDDDDDDDDDVEGGEDGEDGDEGEEDEEGEDEEEEDDEPVGIISYNTFTSRFEAYVFRIIAQEVLNYETRILVVDDQSTPYYGVAGCDCVESQTCSTEPECEDAVEVDEDPEWHFSFGMLESEISRFRQTMVKDYREAIPVEVGFQSYSSKRGMWIKNESRHAALELVEAPLDYYRGYRTSENISRFFDNIFDIPEDQLLPCNESSLHNPTEIGPALPFLGADPGVVVDGSGQARASCYEGNWWLSPTCRGDPHSCIPFLTKDTGVAAAEFMIKSVAHAMPLAVGVLRDFDNNLRQYRVLYLGYRPDPAFVDLGHTEVVFPPHQSLEWAVGNKASASLEDKFYKLMNRKAASTTDGRFLQALVANIDWAKFEMEGIMKHFRSEMDRTGLNENQTVELMSCDWILNNTATWRAWLANPLHCDRGEGLIQTADDASWTWVSNETGATSCHYCGSGRYSAPHKLSDGSSTFLCLPCPPGYEQKLVSQDVCVACGTGEIKILEGEDGCDDCPPGQYVDIEAATLCYDCPAGKITDTEGQEECKECPLGEQSTATAQTDCTLCPAGKFTNQTGTSDCISCDAVLPGSSGPRAATSSAECACPAGFFLNESHGCLACPEGLSCAGGRSTPEQQAGYWVDTGAVAAFNSQNYIVYLCRTASECPAGLMGTCASGRDGVACNNCKDFHYPVDAGVCAPCEGASLAPTVIAVILAPLLFIAIVMVVRLDASRQHLTIVTAGAVAGQVVNLVQLLAATGQIGVTMPQPLSGLLELLGPLVLNLDVLRLSCMLGADDPVVNFILQLLVYPCFLAMLLISLAISRLVKRPLSPMVLFNLNGTLLFTVYISMALAMMIPFQCRSNPGGFSSMATDPGLRCFDDAQHTTLVGLAVFGILVYPVGIAAWLGYVTFKFKTWLQSAPGIRRLTHYRFLFGRFDPQSYFFGIIYLTRNLVLAALPVYLVQFPTLQILGMLAVLVFGSVIQASIWPWRTDAANQTDRVLGIILVLLVGGIGTIIKGDSKEVETAMSIMLTVMVIGAFVGALSMLGFSLYRRYRGAKQFDFFLCHHKAGAGSLCRLLKMMVETSSSANVFIDSDHLNNLDLLFDTVRGQVGHLIVVLSQSVLSRHWCAGEIVTAHRNRVHIVPLVCDDFVRPGTKQIEEIIDNWTGDEVGTLGTFDISVAAIKEAYVHLLGLPMLHLPLYQGLVKKEAALIEVMTACFAIPIYRKCMQEDNARTPAVVVAGGKDSEALSACEIMQVLLQERLEVEVSVVHSEEEARTFAPHARIFLTLFSRGLLHDPAFGKIAYAAFSHPAGSPHLLTAVADGGFQFPPSEFVQDVEAAGLRVRGLNEEQGPGLAKIYQTMLSVLARPFTPLASKGAILEQVHELCGRARPLLEKKGERVIPAVELPVVHHSTSTWSKVKSERSGSTPGSPVGKAQRSIDI